MAAIDVSLDDYIRKNNIYHGPQNANTNKFGNRGNQNGQQRFGQQNKPGFQRGPQQQQQFFKGGMQQRRFQGGQRQGFLRTQKQPGFASGPKQQGFIPGQTAQQVHMKKFTPKPGFVPQQRITAGAGVGSSGKGMGDARDKLVLKTKTSMMDARQKIITSQVKKGVFDARLKLSRKHPRQPQQQQQQQQHQHQHQHHQQHQQQPGPMFHGRPPQAPPPLMGARQGPGLIQPPLHSQPHPHPLTSQPPLMMQQSSMGGPMQLTRKINNTGMGGVSSVVPGGMNLSRTLTNTTVPGPRGTHVQMEHGGNIKVTKTVPDTTVSFDGGSLTVTKRASAIQGTQSGKINVQKTVANPVRGPVIQIQNDKYAQHQHPHPHQHPRSSYSSLSGRFDDAPSSHMRPSSSSGLHSRSAGSSSLPPRAKTAAVSSRTQMSVSSRMAPPAPAPAPTLSTSLKRKHPDSCGPLRFAKSSAESVKPSPAKKIKAAPWESSASRMAMSADMFADVVEEEEDKDDDVLSPLQGYRVLVSNLHSVVNQDDIIELFGAIGALKKARLIKQGTAEVVYVNRDDAVKAVHKYHNRELDGQPMLVKMMTPLTATIKHAEDESPPSALPEPLRLSKPSQGKSNAPYTVEIPVIHKALFKIGSNEPSKPVTFTVKI